MSSKFVNAIGNKNPFNKRGKFLGLGNAKAANAEGLLTGVALAGVTVGAAKGTQMAINAWRSRKAAQTTTPAPAPQAP